MSTTTPVEPAEPTQPTTTPAPPADATPARRIFAVPGPMSNRFIGWLAGLTLLGFLVRVLNVFWWRPTTDAPGYHGYRLWGDAFYYHWQANALAKGAWFVDPYVWHFLGGRQRPSATHPPPPSSSTSPRPPRRRPRHRTRPPPPRTRETARRGSSAAST